MLPSTSLGPNSRNVKHIGLLLRNPLWTLCMDLLKRSQNNSNIFTANSNEMIIAMGWVPVSDRSWNESLLCDLVWGWADRVGAEARSPLLGYEETCVPAQLCHQPTGSRPLPPSRASREELGQFPYNGGLQIRASVVSQGGHTNGIIPFLLHSKILIVLVTFKRLTCCS